MKLKKRGARVTERPGEIKMHFPKSIAERFRVKRAWLAPAEIEYTVPQRGGKGHVYCYGPGWYGVYLTTKRPNKTLNVLRPEFPNMIEQQIGDHECTFRIPAADLERVLERLGAKTRRCWGLTPEQRVELVSRIPGMRRRLRQKHVVQGGVYLRGATQTEKVA